MRASSRRGGVVRALNFRSGPAMTRQAVTLVHGGTPVPVAAMKRQPVTVNHGDEPVRVVKP